MFDKNRTSNNLKDFYDSGFEASYDSNMSQMIQTIVEESRELFKSMLNDSNTNVINTADFDTLVEFLGKSFTEQQEVYKLNKSSAIRPLEYSTRDILLINEAVIPGKDDIKHFYRFDSEISIPRVTEKYILQIVKDSHKGETYNSLNNKHSEILPTDMIVPISYCIPTLGNNDKIESLYKSNVLNVYTNIDKDEFFSYIIKVVSRIQFQTNLIDIDNSNYLSVFRSILSNFVLILSLPNIVTMIIKELAITNAVKAAVFISTFSSINKYYDNISTYGTVDYVIKMFKKTLSTTKITETHEKMWQSHKNTIDVITGSRGMDTIYFHMISDIMMNKSFKDVSNKKEEFLNFITSNSIITILINASISCGGHGTGVRGLYNLIGIHPDDLRVLDVEIPILNVSENNIETTYTATVNTMVAISYSTFCMKHIQIAKERVKDTSSYSITEYGYVKNILESSLNILYHNSMILRKMYKSLSNRRDNFCCVPSAKSREYEYDKSFLTDPYEINIISRLSNLPTIRRIVMNLNAISNDFDTLHRDLDKNPVFGGASAMTMSISGESEDYFSTEFFKVDVSSENFIKQFTKNITVGSNVIKYCDDLKIDTKLAVESGDDAGITDCIKRYAVLNDYANRVTNESNSKIVSKTMRYVANLL